MIYILLLSVIIVVINVFIDIVVVINDATNSAVAFYCYCVIVIDGIYCY